MLVYGLSIGKKFPIPFSVCFSPNSRFIYTVNYTNIQQYDTWDPDSSSAWYHVANMDTAYDYFMGYGMANLAWDQKLYIGNIHGLGNL